MSESHRVIYRSQSGIPFRYVETYRHGQDCSIEMVAYENIEATSDYPAWTPWIMEKALFSRLMTKEVWSHGELIESSCVSKSTKSETQADLSVVNETQAKLLSSTDTEWLEYCIQVIGSTDKDDIESDGVEVYCEDENGIEGSLEESITKRCAQAYELLKSQKTKITELTRQLAAVRKANEELAEQCKENDALKAQVNHLRSEFEFYADETNYEFGDVPGHIYAMDDAGSGARKALEQTPDQCLAEVKASALEDAAERCKGNHPKWGRTHIFLNEESHRIREETANAG